MAWGGLHNGAHRVAAWLALYSSGKIPVTVSSGQNAWGYNEQFFKVSITLLLVVRGRARACDDIAMRDEESNQIKL